MHASVLAVSPRMGHFCDTADEAGPTYDIGQKKLRDYSSENQSFFAFRMLNSLLGSFLPWAPTRLGLRLMKIARDILNAGVPIEPPFLRGKLASARQLPKVIHRRLENRRQFLHGEQVSCCFL